MKIIKRSGAENTFDKEKIENAVAKANITVEEKDRLSEGEIGEIAQNIEDKCSEMNRAMDVETIQDWVEADIMRHGKYTVAKHYITYRYERSIVRQAILLTSRYFLFLTSRTRKSSRKIPIRTLLSIQFRGIIWQARSARISQEDFCFLTI